MYDVITIGGISRDIFFECSNLEVSREPDGKENLIVPYGAKIVADSAYYSYGGGAFNVSIALKKLGLKVAPLAMLGKEGTGSLAVKRLKENGVSTVFVQRTSHYHTGLSLFIIGQNAEHTGFLERGASNHLTIPRISVLKKARWLYVSSLTGKSADLLPEIFCYGARRKIKIAFNPGSEQLKLGYKKLRDYFPGTEILILNRSEAEGLLISQGRKKAKNINDLIRGATGWGAKIIVITDGEMGSYAIAEGKDYHQSSIPVKVADTTGAGDAFGATFLFSIIKGYSIGYGLKIASINAASVVSKIGATEGLLTYNRIKSSKWL